MHAPDVEDEERAVAALNGSVPRSVVRAGLPPSLYCSKCRYIAVEKSENKGGGVTFRNQY